MQFLIPEMKNILQYLDAYEPTEIQPYYPDRILVLRVSGRSPYDENLPEVALPWREHLPSLDSLDTLGYIEGEVAKEIYMLFDNVEMGQLFIQDGQEYSLYISIVLPHEEVTNEYQ